MVNIGAIIAFYTNILDKKANQEKYYKMATQKIQVEQILLDRNCYIKTIYPLPWMNRDRKKYFKYLMCLKSFLKAGNILIIPWKEKTVLLWFTLKYLIFIYLKLKLRARIINIYFVSIAQPNALGSIFIFVCILSLFS